MTAFFDDLHRFFIVITESVILKDRRRFHRHRTIHIDIEIRIRQHVIFQDLPDEIQDLLGPAYGKRRNDDISASFKCAVHDIGKLFQRVIDLVVETIAIGTFRNDIVGSFSWRGIVDDRHAGIA